MKITTRLKTPKCLCSVAPFFLLIFFLTDSEVPGKEIRNKDRVPFPSEDVVFPFWASNGPEGGVSAWRLPHGRHVSPCIFIFVNWSTNSPLGMVVMSTCVQHIELENNDWRRKLNPFMKELLTVSFNKQTPWKKFRTGEFTSKWPS